MATQLLCPTPILQDEDAYYLTGEGTLLDAGVEEDQPVSGELANLLNNVQQDSDVVSGNTTTTPPVATPTPTPTGTSLHMIDMIKHLLTSYNI